MNETKILIGGNLLFIAGMVPASLWFVWIPLLMIGWYLLMY